MDPGLYVVGTPIGNLADLSTRAVEVLRQIRWILAEDTRVTRKLLARYGLSVPLQSCHKFSEASRIESVCRHAAIEPVALVTDSGMPAISDPGARIVRACRQAGIRIWVIPGPSALTAALAISGYPADRFTFGGFLPSHGHRRERVLEELLQRPETLVLFESPHRILRLLEELEARAPQRRVCVCRELTKMFEETIEGTVPDVRARLSSRPARGEYTVVLAPPDLRGTESDFGEPHCDESESRCPNSRHPDWAAS